jgi:hypothetical protein
MGWSGSTHHAKSNISKIALSIKEGGAKNFFPINQFDFRTCPLAAAAPAVSRPATAVDLAPLASSLLGTGQQAAPAPMPRPRR